jgi:hypothetical protein
MHPHDFLLAVVIALTQPVVYGITAPLGINGFLKQKLGYVFHFSDMEEARTRGMSLPDGLIYNEKNRMLLIPECKSSLRENEDDARLIKQLQCYSTTEFLKIVHRIIPDFTGSEIVIVTFPEAAKEIQLLIRTHSSELGSILNTVIWTVDRVPKTDQLITKLFSGRHSDNLLNAAMSQGILCKPPPREFLSSPDIPDSRFASILGRRFLASVASGIKNSSIAYVLEENKDLAVSYTRLRRILSALFKLVPELGSYDRRKGTMEFKSHVDYSVVHGKLREIGQMNKATYLKALGEPVEKEAPLPVEKLKPTRQVLLADFLRAHKRKRGPPKDKKD